MDRSRLPLRFSLTGRQITGVTLFADGADQVLVLASTFPDVVFEVRSVYIGGEGTPEVVVSEAVTCGDDPTRFAHRRLVDASGVLVFERRRALYDHLQRLQELIAGEGLGDLRVQGLDEAVRELDPAHGVASQSELV